MKRDLIKDRAWVSEYLQGRSPGSASKVLDVISAYESAMRDGSLSDGQLDLVLGAFLAPGKPSEYVAELFGELAGRFPSARVALGMQTSHSRSDVRLKALLAAESTGSREYLLDVSRIALVDESRRIRSMAAEMALRSNAKELIEDLERAEKREEDQTIAAELIRARNLLRDGRHIWKSAGGIQWTTYMDRDGSVTSRQSDT